MRRGCQGASEQDWRCLAHGAQTESRARHRRFSYRENKDIWADRGWRKPQAANQHLKADWERSGCLPVRDTPVLTASKEGTRRVAERLLDALQELLGNEPSATRIIDPRPQDRPEAFTTITFEIDASALSDML